MDFIFEHGTEFIIGTVCSLFAAAIVMLITWSRKLPPLSVPLWVVALFVAIPIAIFSVPHFTNKSPKAIVDQDFTLQRVVLDGKKFIRCKFDRCSLVFKGKAPFGFEHCGFTMPEIVFEDAAGTVIYEIGIMSSDPTFASIIQNTMDNIKQKTEGNSE